MSPPVQLSAGSLCVRFQSWNDRLSHMIGLMIDGNFVPMLESIEGTAIDPWPVSPPMQQMVEEAIGPGNLPVLLGVGLSGNGHWSIAIDSPTHGTLKFDVACKNSKSSTWFGSQYRVPANVTCAANKDGSVSLKLQSPQVSNPSLHAVMRATIGELRYEATEHRLTSLPTTHPSELQTHRWCFEVATVKALSTSD